MATRLISHCENRFELIPSIVEIQQSIEIRFVCELVHTFPNRSAICHIHTSHTLTQTYNTNPNEPRSTYAR